MAYGQPFDPSMGGTIPGAQQPQTPQPWFMQGQPGAPSMVPNPNQNPDGSFDPSFGGAIPGLDPSQSPQSWAPQGAPGPNLGPTRAMAQGGGQKPSGTLDPAMYKSYLSGMHQMQQANALRNYGQQLNTGSVGGGAPNWAGALANIFLSGAAKTTDQAGYDAMSQYFKAAQKNSNAAPADSGGS